VFQAIEPLFQPFSPYVDRRLCATSLSPISGKVLHEY